MAKKVKAAAVVETTTVEAPAPVQEFSEDYSQVFPGGAEAQAASEGAQPLAEVISPAPPEGPVERDELAEQLYLQTTVKYVNVPWPRLNYHHQNDYKRYADNLLEIFDISWKTATEEAGE